MKAAVRIEDRVEPLRAQPARESGDPLLRELIAHLRQNRTQLRGDWARRIRDAQLLTAMSEE